MSEYLFTSESVSEGHPDKVADQISDAILDALLAQDPKSRVAAETLCTTGLVLLAGEITSKANIDYIGVARDTIARIGYDNTEYGIDYKGCSVQVAYDKQSPDIAQGVDRAEDDNLDQGAGDQGLHQGEQRKHRPVLGEVPAKEDVVDGPVADRLGDRSDYPAGRLGRQLRHSRTPDSKRWQSP
mgnify:CR=1 FL=1